VLAGYCRHPYQFVFDGVRPVTEFNPTHKPDQHVVSGVEPRAAMAYAFVDHFALAAN
jgi:hypothetical protein